jgi:hypothetical protein
MDTDERLARIREVVKEARAVIEDGDASRSANRAGVLGLYENLCRALDGVDAERVRLLLGRIAEQLESLNELSEDIDRIRRLRNIIKTA